MRLEFWLARWKNFLSTGNHFSEIDLHTHPTTLMVGRNGHGKSTLLDVLTFGLFGKPFRRINLDGLINSVNGKDSLVEIEFKIMNNHYMVRRGLKPRIFEIYINGNLVDQTATPDYQKYLEKNILKFNFKSFTQIVILGSSSFVPFMKLTTQDRRAIIEELLDIQVFSNMNRLVKDQLKTLTNDISNNKRDIENTQSQIELQKKYVEDSKKNNNEQIHRKNNEIVINKKLIKDQEHKIALLNKEISELRVETTDKPELEAKLQKLNGLERKIGDNATKAKKEVLFYKEHDHCPTCHQNIDEAFKSNSIYVNEESYGKYIQGLDDIRKQQNLLIETIGDINTILSKIESLELEIRQINLEINHTQRFNQNLKKEVEELSERKVLSDDMMKISIDLVQKLQTLNDQRRELIELRIYTEASANLLKDNGIKAKIIKQYLPVINKLVNKYLSAMDFFVNFELNEEFEESIKSRHRDSFQYDSFSEGEKQMIDIALLFAWRGVAKMKNSMNTNLLVLDEIFDSSLDTIGADLLMGILDSMPNQSNIFVISHRELLHDKFKNSIKFEKQNNFSTMI